MLFYPQENTVLSDIIIQNNRFGAKSGRQSGNGNNGNGIHQRRFPATQYQPVYPFGNLLVQNNRFIAAENNAPLRHRDHRRRGSERHSRQEEHHPGFTAAWLVANPAK